MVTSVEVRDPHKTNKKPRRMGTKGKSRKGAKRVKATAEEKSDIAAALAGTHQFLARSSSAVDRNAAPTQVSGH